MKAIKVIGKILLWTLAVVVVLLLALPLWIGPVVKGVANSVVPGITGTDFHLGEFGLNPYTGTLHVGDMQLANPTNFSEKNAVDLKAFDVDFAMTSLFSGKKYRVEFVEVNGIVVHSDFPKGDNFMQILENATGGDVEPEAEAKEGEQQPDVEPEAPKSEGTAESAESEQVEEKESKGVQIDRITLKDVTIKYGLPVKIPMDIELTGIGAESENGACRLHEGQVGAHLSRRRARRLGQGSCRCPERRRWCRGRCLEGCRWRCGRHIEGCRWCGGRHPEGCRWRCGRHLEGCGRRGGRCP